METIHRADSDRPQKTAAAPLSAKLSESQTLNLPFEHEDHLLNCSEEQLEFRDVNAIAKEESKYS
jgi:hypothetical protein